MRFRNPNFNPEHDPLADLDVATLDALRLEVGELLAALPADREVIELQEMVRELGKLRPALETRRGFARLVARLVAERVEFGA